ncbi:hypothetical protein [Haloprofundus halophilus]|uniref:hypothetical protein n=1 Tax=Haloprofundus halophilus TaxID=2283527 RepID=UPI000E4529CB|nr:hypothetical protein [Haloprofundus halophilus]
MSVRNDTDVETGTDAETGEEAIRADSGTGRLEEERSNDTGFGRRLLGKWRIWLLVLLSLAIFAWSLLPNPTPPGYTEVFLGVAILGAAYAIQDARNKSLFG